MKKYGKYEKMPDGTRAKQPKVKNVLLQTYFTSLLCMVLCVTMFFGTSYAWFTSEVNNAGNEIYIGTLKVDLDKKTGDGENDWTSLSAKNEDGTNTNCLFDKNIRWEPGYTSLETIRVVNKGDLAFKYNLNFTDGKIANDTESDLATVAGNFEVWVFNHQDTRFTFTQPGAYESITEANGWIPVGSLADVLNGKAVLEDKIMQTVRTSDPGADPSKATNPGTTDGVATADTYTIALHMKEDAAGQELMGKKITLNVKLVAYQMGHEEDSFGNSAYDEAKFVTTAKELQAALDNATGDTVIRFVNDITGDVTVNQNINAKLVIDGNGKTMNGSINIKAQSETSAPGSIVIKGINFKTTDSERDFIHSAETNHYPINVTVSGCTFEGSGAGSDVVGIRVKSAKNLVIENCKADNMHSVLHNTSGWNLTVKGVEVTNSGRGMSLGTVQGATLTDVTVDVEKYGVRMDAASNTETVFTDCKISAYAPVVVRAVTSDYKLSFNGTNTMSQKNTNGIWCAIATNEYESGVNPEDLTAPGGMVSVILNDTGLNGSGIYIGQKASN